MGEDKVVHFHLFRPENAIFKNVRLAFFQANARSEIQIITCNNSENCQYHSRGECVCRYSLFGTPCPYGKLKIEQGFTRRARKYNEWCRDKEEKYNGVPYLKSPKMLGIVGEFVFLPYSFIDMAKNYEWTIKGFIRKEEFTADRVIEFVHFQPQALMGGEIRDYQKKVPPELLKHLSEQMPKLFKEVIAKDAKCRERYAEFSNIGRKAILQTLTPNVGQFKDIHGGLWKWDGKQLHSENSKMSFGLTKFSKASITPLENQEVEITDESQINENTVFVF